MFRRSSLAMIFFVSALCLTGSVLQTAAAAESDLVVVRVSGEPITEKQVLSTIELLARQTLLKPEERSQRNSLLFKDAIENLVTVALLKNEARKQNVKVDPAKVDQQVQQYASRFPSTEEFKKALASQETTDEEMRKSIEESLSMQQVLDTATKGLPAATEQEIQKYYESNLDKFALPEKAHVAQIFLKKDPGITPEQRAEIRKKLEQIRADIESGKISFADAADRFSEDAANAAKGGDLGTLPRGRMLRQLEEAAYAATPGTLTPVIETQAGFHLIRVIETMMAGMKTLEDARPEIRQLLEQNTRQRAIQKYMAELKANAAIETFMTVEEFSKRHP